MPGYDWKNFKGFEGPRYTQVPDQLFDELLPHLGPAEVKVLLYIIRRTYGWRKDEDNISLSQIADGTGLTRRSVQRAVKDLEEKTIILVGRGQDIDGGYVPNVYRLRQRHSTDNLKSHAGARHERRDTQQPSDKTDPRDIESPPMRQKFPPGRDIESPPKSNRVTRGRGTESSTRNNLLQTKATESDRAVPSTPPRDKSDRSTVLPDSDSDISQIAWEMATTLGREKAWRQLTTWASRNHVTPELLQAAGEATIRQRDSGRQVKEPIAYLQTVAKVMLAHRQEAAGVGERKGAERRQAALAYARQIYGDKIIGRDWRQVEAILRESYGPKLAVEVIEQLRSKEASE